MMIGTESLYGAEFSVVFLAKGLRTAIQEGLDCLRLNHSGLERERDFRFVVELPYLPPHAHTACAGTWVRLAISTDMSGTWVTASPT